MYNNFNFYYPWFYSTSYIWTNYYSNLKFHYLKPVWIFICLCICLSQVHFSLCPWKEILSITSWFLRVWFSLGAPPWITAVYWIEIQGKPRKQSKTQIKLIFYYKDKKYKSVLKFRHDSSTPLNLHSKSFISSTLYKNPSILFSVYI